MEIEGESLQSSCQEALPPVETADVWNDLSTRLSQLSGWAGLAGLPGSHQGTHSTP